VRIAALAPKLFENFTIQARSCAYVTACRLQKMCSLIVDLLEPLISGEATHRRFLLLADRRRKITGGGSGTFHIVDAEKS
jgi:hypothetical protein